MADSPYIYEITPENFEQIIIQGSHQVPILVDFWADWCQPCQMLMPVLSQLANEYQGKFILAKVNTEQHQQLAAQFQVRSLPTVKLFKDGQAIDEFMGALPESDVRAFLDKHIERESDAAVDQGLALVDAGEFDAALELLAKAQAEDPNNYNLLFAMAQAHFGKGDIDSATFTLDAMPPEIQETPEVKQFRGKMKFGQMSADGPDVAELEQRLEKDDNDSEARYQLAVQMIAQQNHESAFEHLLQLMQKAPDYEDGAARKTLLDLFESLGSDPMVATYRRKMFNLLH